MKKSWLLNGILALSLLPAPAVLAAVSFHADFNGDRIADSGGVVGPNGTVTVDIFVSGVPALGLLSMGALIGYDDTVFQVESATADLINWDTAPFADWSTPGQATFGGWRIPPPLAGDGIALGSVTLQRIGPGSSMLWLRDPNTYDDMVYDDGGLCDNTVFQCAVSLDSAFGSGVMVGLLVCPGDLDGDEDMDGQDLALLSQQIASCSGSCTGDLNGDHLVTNADAQAFAQNFFGNEMCQ